MKTVKKQNNKVNKFNIQLPKVLIVILIIAMCIAMIRPVQASTLTPNDSQYIEMRAKDINDVNNGKQLLFELWAHDIDFKGFDVRFKYDDTKLEPSNINTNEIVDVDVDDFSTYFKFENEFENAFDCFAMIDSNATNTNVIRMIFSIDTPADETEHIKNDTFISSSQDVLIGKMSFNMKEEPFDITGFSLITDESSSPTTGIKINTNVTDNYQAQSTFRFTDNTASKDATLKNIKISREIEDESNPGTMIDKDYPLDPVFDPATKTYNLEILEYIDTIDLLVEKNDEKATMKLKFPKRNIEKDPLTDEITKDELVYGTPGDESTIQYDEIDLADSTKQSIVLNKLGEPDTVLTIEVTAEDGTTKENYEITIHRPYATVKGTIQLGDTLKEKAEANGYTPFEIKAEIKAYKADEFDWNGVTTKQTEFSVLDTLKILARTESNYDDGTFEMLVVPGKYDIFIEKLGFTQIVYTKQDLQEGDIKELGKNILYEGDINRDGLVNIQDYTKIINLNGQSATNGKGLYDEKYDFQKKGFINITDITSVSSNLKKGKKLVIK